MPHTSFTKATVLSINNSSFTHIAGNQYNYNYTVEETGTVFPAPRRQKHGRTHGPTSTALDAKEDSHMQKTTAPCQSHNQPNFEDALVPSGAPETSTNLYRPSPPPSRPGSTPRAPSVGSSPSVPQDPPHESLRSSNTVYASNPHGSPSTLPSSWNSCVANIQPYPYSLPQSNRGNPYGAAAPPQAPFPANGPGVDEHQNRHEAWTTNSNCNPGGWYRDNAMREQWNAPAPLPVYAQFHAQTYSYNPNICQGSQHLRHFGGFVRSEDLYQHNINNFNPQPIRYTVPDNGALPPQHQVGPSSELQES